MQFEFPQKHSSIIKVIGVGGGGSNAVNNMFTEGIDGVEFMVSNTDLQALNNSPVPVRIRLGANQTEGLGAGANPDVGRKSAVESLEEVRTTLKDGTKMLFVTAGMGGGTGTGAAPVVAAMAKEMNILTVGIVTLPFDFEGPRRKTQAIQGIKELQAVVDTLLVVDNNNLLKILGNKVSMKKAFSEADRVLCNAAKGIAEIITSEGYINVDFADVCTIMRDGGKALMGTATAAGEDRAELAVRSAITSPLLDNISMKGARAIIVNITADEDSLGMQETSEILNRVQESAGKNADIIYGVVYDPAMGDSLRVTVIATRFGDDHESETAVLKEDTSAELEPEMIVAPAPKAPVRQVQLQAFEDDKRPFSRLTQREREERLARLNSKQYDMHDTESLQGLESMPAYLRKKVTLTDPEKQNPLSHTSLDEDGGKYRLSENNPFLHDNVD
jgi:cell division protein FtsZ